MLGCQSHSLLINLDCNESNTLFIRHGRSLFPISKTQLSSLTCFSMAIRNDSATEFKHSQRSHKLSASGSENPSVSRSSGKFGRLKVQRVRPSRPEQRVKEERINDKFSRRKRDEEEPSSEFDEDFDYFGSDSESESARGGGRGSDPWRWERSKDMNRSENRRPTVESSRGWNLRYDESFEQSQRQNPGSDSDFYSRRSFRDAGCAEFMIECLRKQRLQRPSHIQAMAFAPVKEGKSCILADQSGSGKTLAYLMPVIERLREEEVAGLSVSTPRSPRVVVLVPTAELATQVLGVCRSISKNGVPFKSMVVTGGFRQKTQLENLEQGVDVLVATPGRFMYLMKEGFLKLSNLRSAVLDEIDILYKDEDFEAVLQSLISSSPVTAQYLFVTATLPVAIYNKLVEVFPDCEVIMGPGIHRTSVGLEEVLVDCSGDDETEKNPETAFANKKTALLQLVEGNRVPKTIVFCNKIETCRKVENVLKRFDKKEIQVQVLPFHAAMTQESRLANIKEFTNSRPEKISQFLVCTDRASRGMDFAAVNHVVLFDFPRDPSEYVRRVGRTARGASGMGKAFIFVVGKQVSLARRIMERNQKGHPLHDVPAAYELFR